ncbi:HD-GYP domain-containing protein [Clostridium sp. LP20]|uniref:HD-GYP domain-containing protein n=1 Tax=Clostridium sp. LP20 TaxID=3418665 RepID=UPI003EE5A402
MRHVPIECVRNGSYLGKTIYDNTGRVLLKSGVRLTESLIKRIKASGIFSIYIVDEYSEGEIEDIIKPELRQKSILLIKETFNNIERLNQLTDCINTSGSTVIKMNHEYLESITEVSEELLDNILANKNLLVSLVDIKSMDNYTYQHSVNVAVISIVLGISLKLPKQDLLDLCMGALLHDIGKVFVPGGIITKEGPLTPDEYELIKKHPQNGYEYLSNQYSIKSSSKVAILQHHERVDGLGYPDGLEGSKINKLAKIVAIADVYDALTSDRCYRRALCASDALEYIMANAGSIFDFEMAAVFSRVIVPFPSGTIVKLSNGNIAIVKETLPNYPLRPTVKILKSSDKSSEGKLINLIDELSLVISSVEYNV